MDFERDPLAWRCLPSDSDFVSFRASDTNPIGGERSFYVQASGWDTTRTDNECVRLCLDLAAPLAIDSTTEVSWLWRIGNTKSSDGVVLSLALTCSDNPEAKMLSWWSHSLHTRVMCEGSDPEGVVVSRRARIYDRIVELYGRRPIGLVTIHGLWLELAMPFRQEVWLDDLRIGPAACHPPASSTAAPSLAVTPAPTNFVLADFDTDGWADLLCGSASGPPVLRLRFGDRNGAAESFVQSLTGAEGLSWPVAADLDQDGIVDLAGIAAGQVRAFRGLGEGQFREQAVPGLARLHERLPWRVDAADVRSSSGVELVVQRLSTLYHDTLLVAEKPWQWRAEKFPDPCGDVPQSGYRHALAFADLDLDFDLDVYACNSDVYLQDEGKLVCATDQWLERRGTYQTGATFGDIDNDRDMDLFITVDIRNKKRAPEVTDRHPLLLRNDGDHFTDISDWLQPLPPPHTLFPIIEDFDLDGDQDIFCVQFLGWEPRPTSNQQTGIYYRNDGPGRFIRCDQLDFPGRISNAVEAASCDADRDGDPDLVIKTWDDEQVVLLSNPINGGRAIRVTVLDKRGAPHASAAQVTLFDELHHVSGFRQSGAGSMYPGWGQTTFGCPSMGPYGLEVIFPGQKSRAIARNNLEPGSAVTIVEPLWEGSLGSWAAIWLVNWNRIARALCARPRLMIAVGALLGVVCGVVLIGTRSRLAGLIIRLNKSFNASAVLRSWHSVPPGDPFFQPRIYRAVVLPAMILPIIVIPGLFIWPPGPQAALGRYAILAGVFGGIVIGGLAGAWISAHRSKPGTEVSRDALLEAIDGFSHAPWLSYFDGLSFLLQSAQADPGQEQVHLELKRKLSLFDSIVQPQLAQIERWMAVSDVDPALVRSFGVDLRELRLAVSDVAASADAAAPDPPDAAAVALITKKVPELRQKVDLLFRELGQNIRADVAETLRLVIDVVAKGAADVEIDSDIPEDLPPVFAEPGALANIFENLLRNGCRAAAEMASVRVARVIVRARREAAFVHVTMADTGGGMTPEILETVSMRNAARPGGKGRGLPYAHRKLSQFDAKIRFIRSSPETGTEVRVTLRTC